MESFIVYLPTYLGDAKGQANIDAFNVTALDSDELLAQPQNIKMGAYQELASSMYPPTLPYHQPLDAQRTFLNFLGVSRADLCNTFRPKCQRVTGGADPELAVQLAQRGALNAQYYCEILGLIQEEFLILTKSVFWEQQFFD
jgi:hypothetical protein